MCKERVGVNKNIQVQQFKLQTFVHSLILASPKSWTPFNTSVGFYDSSHRYPRRVPSEYIDSNLL